uniref:Uncharacterized protein n=1 Tax=Hyaloperonospora arabidopsidis (strain Emoy2) TaxID=559515 RepID=M4BVR7_HYAAE
MLCGNVSLVGEGVTGSHFSSPFDLRLRRVYFRRQQIVTSKSQLEAYTREHIVRAISGIVVSPLNQD